MDDRSLTTTALRGKSPQRANELTGNESRASGMAVLAFCGHDISTRSGEYVSYSILIR